MYTFELPYPPSANRYWRNFRGRTVKSEEARQYQQLAWLLAKQAMSTPLAGPVAIELCIYRPQRRGDLDNRIKVCLDALQGCAYHNDSQVTELHAYLFDDKTRPRVKITVNGNSGGATQGDLAQHGMGAAPQEALLLP